jgi:hypothetical protein
MKKYFANKGPFTERPYFSNSEIEKVCSDELRAVNLYPDIPSPVRIDRFIEKCFKVVPSYEDLGNNILGMTVFGPTGVAQILVSKALEEDGSVAAERRIRTTLAHEGGHGLFHTELFAMALQKKPLFGDLSDPNAPKVLCRDEGEGTLSYKGQWWEYQANKAIGALLMPKSLVETSLDEFFSTKGLLGLRVFDHNRSGDAVRSLVDTFNVNPVVARIRLGQLFPQSESMQMSL